MSAHQITIRLLIALIAILVSVAARSEEFTTCPLDQLSHVQASKCLEKEYRGTDALLKRKVAQLVEIAEPVDVSYAAVDIVQAKRRQIQDAIRQADALWRKNLQAECDTLIEASFGLGNGWDIDSYECRLTRTRERIKFLSVSPSYSWLWK